MSHNLLFGAARTIFAPWIPATCRMSPGEQCGSRDEEGTMAGPRGRAMPGARQLFLNVPVRLRPELLIGAPDPARMRLRLAC